MWGGARPRLPRWSFFVLQEAETHHHGLALGNLVLHYDFATERTAATTLVHESQILLHL